MLGAAAHPLQLRLAEKGTCTSDLQRIVSRPMYSRQKLPIHRGAAAANSSRTAGLSAMASQHTAVSCGGRTQSNNVRCSAATQSVDASLDPSVDTGTASAAAGAGATSLIPQTMEEMAADEEAAATRELLERRGQAALTREERRRRQRSLDAIDAPPFLRVLQDSGAKSLVRGPAGILQLNIGLYCNQACSHCHVESSPLRTEAMDRATADRCLELLQGSCSRAGGGAVHTLDITGGAPELSHQFRYVVERARDAGVADIIDRCNLTVLLEPGQEDLVEFLATNRVRIAASLPCYSAANVDQQRGGGVFERSIKGLQLLNAAGYGVEGSGLELDLVYNPNGEFLAPPQAALEEAYRSELREAYGIVFSRLFALNNMPIKRYVDHLLRRGKLEDYMQLLVQNFNASAANGVMCRDTVSVRWDGALHDCDFNQQLALGLAGKDAPRTVWDIESLDELTGRPIAVDNHCFGCTAGSGSGCQGAVS
mmetsp:Transcript_18915/g.57145  ORF Transcript_18915/g.57145 Transcript_18915/m.57145 type:complete len:482 (+) Transcript_18915:194-1639(+)